MSVHGRNNVAGHLYLTTRRVCFEPTAASDAPDGEAWAADIGSIRSARMLSAGSTLLLDVAGGQRRLRGAGAQVVHDRLVPLIRATGTSDPGAAERVLLKAPAAVEVNDLLSASGEVTVTTLRIRFQPSRMDALVGLATAFEDKIADITGFGFTGLLQRLEVRTATRTTRFMGEVVPALYGALQCGTDAKGGDVPDEAIQYSVVPAARCRGLVTHPGALVVTPSRLAFVATGLLDSLVGLEGLTETPVGAITSIGLVGKLEPRIEVASASGRMSYACSDANDQYEHLVAWLASRLEGPIWLGAGADPVPPEVAEHLAPYLDSWALPERPQMFTPAVGLGLNRPATPGFLVVGQDTMVWLPGPTPHTAGPPVSLHMGRARWVWSTERDEVRVDREGAIHRWVTRSGNPFRTALFDRVERIKKRIALAWGSAGTGIISAGQNRRDSYRVQISEETQPAFSIWTAADGEFLYLKCRLAELSLGGCSIRTPYQLASDLLLRVEFTENGRVYSVRASVAYTRQRPSDKGWMAGLAFVGTPVEFDGVLRHVWMTMQQEQLRTLRGESD